ncbi:MAG TPA: hypothetical protein VHE79_11540 [Spirochaetia bacterium]
MWYTILITLVVDFGGLLLLYVILSNRLRRASTTEAQIAEIRDEVSRLLVELNQTTERNIALVEDKIATLNDILSQADKKIGLLHREIEKHDVGSQIYSRLAERKPRPSPERPVSERPSASETPVEAPRAAAEPVPRTTAHHAEPPQEKQLAVELSEGPDLHERVMMLHRSGFAPSLIASRVGVPLGEVELIISLEQRKGKA